MARLLGFHCLAPDLPGHGRSNHLPLPPNDRLVDSLAELIETRVPTGRAHVVGVSWGAFLVHLLLERHPERVERAVADGLPLVWPRGAGFLFLSGMALATPFLHTPAIGTDYTECGIVKYLAREGAPELAPYLCWIDYPMCAAAGLRLDRTETLAQGGQRCDFRMSRGKPVQVEPESLHV